MPLERVRIIALIVSLLLHILLLLLFTGRRFPILFPEEIPIVSDTVADKRIVFELVETPASVEDREPAEDTNLISDKNQAARDDFTDQPIPDGEPYASGDFDIREYENIVPEDGVEQAENLIYPDLKELIGDLGIIETGNIPEALTLEDVFPTDIDRQKPRYDNTLTSVRDYGGLSFNTYEWDFAPYLLDMKRRIENKVKPPPAFYHMGIISGEAKIRFIVNPDGRIRALEVLESQGHESLTQTSVSAIEWAAPFLPLPGNFPEDFLEVTARFSYIIRKK
ncbi:MAG: energy transducer TonB [Candidatus Cloacimonetes bacterium]|nr:energy transducer TonB [Candidatus Cloacimonadota bacterium]